TAFTPWIRMRDKFADDQLALGVEQQGLHAVEALMMARHFMYAQVYFHPVRFVNDIHLQEFLRLGVKDWNFPLTPARHLRSSHNAIMAALWEAIEHLERPGHEAASRILLREHYRVFYQLHPGDVRLNPEAVVVMLKAAKDRWGDHNVRRKLCVANTQEL